MRGALEAFASGVRHEPEALATALSLFETGAVVVDHSARLHVRTGEAA